MLPFCWVIEIAAAVVPRRRMGNESPVRVLAGRTLGIEYSRPVELSARLNRFDLLGMNQESYGSLDGLDCSYLSNLAGIKFVDCCDLFTFVVHFAPWRVSLKISGGRVNRQMWIYFRRLMR